MNHQRNNLKDFLIRLVKRDHSDVFTKGSLTFDDSDNEFLMYILLDIDYQDRPIDALTRWVKDSMHSADLEETLIGATNLKAEYARPKAIKHFETYETFDVDTNRVLELRFKFIDQYDCLHTSRGHVSPGISDCLRCSKRFKQ